MRLRGREGGRLSADCRELPGPGFTLEPQVAAHAEAMFEVLSDPAIYAHENEPPASLEWLRARFTRLETRRSGDGTEQWLNWVIRLPDGRLAGYVQATVAGDGDALVAYVLGSAHWGRGLARSAVRVMVAELAARHGATGLTAVLKRTNARSRRLLESLGFAEVPEAEARGLDPDERMMRRAISVPA